MKKRTIGALAFVVICSLTSVAQGQTPAPSVEIPLGYLFDSQSNAARLAINVGINGGAPRPYLFDTGSTLFNAAFDPANWGSSFSQYTSSVPPAAVANGTGVQICYSGSTPTSCRGYTGNIVQVPLLSFYAPGATGAANPAATLTASPGFQISAVSNYSDPSSGINDTFPSYFTTQSGPVQEGLFYGVFGSRISVDELPKDQCPGSSNCYVSGGVLGQTIIPGAARQGFVVAANGQANPANPGTPANPPTGNATVTVGGQTRDVTSCNPCVTVGLTPELIGQFAPVAMPTAASAPGLVQWVTSSTPGPSFPNPYGGTTGNNAAPTDATYFTVTVSGSPGTTATTFALLDTGTKYFSLSGAFPFATSGTVSISGATPTGGPIAGIPTSTSTLFGTPSYYVDGSGSTSTIGIPFFMQNSVLFDLTDQATGYTPFFVTASNLATTAGGPLIVTSANVPLGLAGIVSGPGGVTVGSGAAVQLSAANTYTGPTTIAGAAGGSAAGQLLISGPGSIAASSGVANDGVLDISRAWAPVAIASLSGSGRVNLGGQNLTIANGSGTFSGILADGGEYPVGGGSVTVAGGTQTFAGTGAYTGGTMVSGGTLALTGTLTGGLTVLPGGTFQNAGTFDSQGAGVLNAGTTINGGTFASNVLNTGFFANNGTFVGTFANVGVVTGPGTFTGMLANAGAVAPGPGTMTVNGTYSQSPAGVFQVAATPSGQSGALNVGGTTGTAALAGSVLVQPQAGTYAPRTTYTILRASGGVSGSFASVASSLPFLQPSLGYDANNVYLTLEVGGFAQRAQTPNQAAVGAVLDALAPTATGDFATVLAAFSTLTAQQGIAAMNAISGQNYAAFSSSGIATTQVFMANFANTVGGSSGGANRVALAEACDIACDTTEAAKWGAWGGAVGGFGTVGGTANAGTLTYSLGGFAAGLDRRVTPDLLVGATVGYSNGTQWVGGFSGRGTSDTVQGGLYASYAPGALYLDGLAAYAYSDNRLQRQIALPGLTRTATGQTGANLFFGQVEAGYRIEIGGRAAASITPFGRLQAATATQNGFTESGAGSLSLTVASQTTHSLRSVVGAQLGGAMDLGWRDRLAMQFKLGWGHEYADTARPVTASFVGAPSLPFTTYGAAPQRDSAVVGLAATTAVADATSVYFRYEGDLAAQAANHALTAGFRMTW